MPYRRLPNTDQSRIHALEKAIEKEGFQEQGQLVLSYRTIQDSSSFLNQFKRAHQQYQQCYESQARSSKDYRSALHTARLYVSHFIQVLYMTIQRGELRKEIKSLYGINPDDTCLPDLSSEASLYEWGKKIIAGEDERVGKGGVPIYNPTIAKVKVFYQLFAEQYFGQKMLQSSTAKALETITQMRPMADTLILDIWNQVEAVYQDLPQEERIEQCSKFGLIYYYRSSEKARREAEKMQQALTF
jgi:hypothetical protein